MSAHSKWITTMWHLDVRSLGGGRNDDDTQPLECATVSTTQAQHAAPQRMRCFAGGQDTALWPEVEIASSTSSALPNRRPVD